MPKELQPLVINAPRQGIAGSPHVGFGDCRNLDINSIPGIAQLNNILAATSGTIPAQINWLVRHPITTTEIYALASTGKVYKSTNSGATFAELTGTSTTNANGNGMWIWKNYLFVARDALLDVCGDGTATGITNAGWTLGWKTIDSDVLWHPMFQSKNDGKLYGGAGRYVFSLEELTTFAPGTGTTFTWTQQALDLPASYRIKCLEELGNNLMSGTWQGTAVTDIRVADIFPWDRSSTTFGQPISLDEFGIHAMKNMGNFLIVLAGISGVIYRSDGANIYPIGELKHIDLSGGKYLEYYPGGICSYKNKVFFGVGQGGTTAIGGMGVYSLLQTGQGNILNLEHLVGTLSDGSSNPLKPSALLPVTRDTLLVGYRDNTTYRIDLTTATSYAYGTDYSGYFESPLYPVGSFLNKRVFTQLNFLLAKEIATGEGIRIKFRVNLTDSWTTIGTYTYSSLGSKSDIISHHDKCGIPACELLQIRVELLGTSSSSPQFKSLTLY